MGSSIVFVLFFTSFTGTIVTSSDAISWKLQQKSVCFEGKGKKFGAFTMKEGGNINSVKLVHTTGYISCRRDGGHSNWGCGGKHIGIVITNAKNKRIFPNKIDSKGWSVIPPYTSRSKELVFTRATTRHARVKKGDQIRIWYWQDLKDTAQDDNHGKLCRRVCRRASHMETSSTECVFRNKVIWLRNIHSERRRCTKRVQVSTQVGVCDMLKTHEWLILGL